MKHLLLLILATIATASCITSNECDNQITGKYITAVQYPRPFVVIDSAGTQYNVFMPTDEISTMDKGHEYTLCYELRGGYMYAD